MVIPSQNITKQFFKHIVFDTKVIFDFFGIAVFDNCTVYSHHFVINLFRSQTELKPTYKHLPSFLKYTEKHSLEFRRTQFKRISPHNLLACVITVVNAVRRVHFFQCNISGYPEYVLSEVYCPLVQIYMGKSGYTYLDYTILSLLVEQSVLVKTWLDIQCLSIFSIAFVKIEDVDLHDSIVTKLDPGGVVGFRIENSIFSASSESRPGGVHLDEIVYLHIINCEFNIYDTNCVEGCAVLVQGLRSFDQIIHQFASGIECDLLYPRVIIEDSVFYESMAQSSGGITSIMEVEASLKNCIFRTTSNSKPPPVGGIIYYDSIPFVNSRFEMNNITFDMQELNEAVAVVSLVSYSWISIRNVTISCSQTFKTTFTTSKLTASISCDKSCPREYTLQAGNITYESIELSYNYTSVHNTSWFIPLCFPCPVGANCDNKIRPLPNYWGYKNKQDKITMVKCPTDYCYTRNETCKDIESCNTGRTGTLCGTCQSNLTEALFSAKCVPFKDCKDTLIVIMYLLCIVGYSIMLLVSESIKNKIIEAFKKLSKVWKQRQHCTKHQEISDNVQELVEISDKAGTSMDDSDTQTAEDKFLWMRKARKCPVRMYHIPNPQN